MHRTQIYIDDSEWVILKELASKNKKTVSDLIRNAVKKIYFGDQRLDFARAIDDVSGIWSDRELNSDDYIRNLRKGNRKNLGYVPK